MSIYLNPFSSKFLNSKNSQEEDIEKEIIKNSQGITVNELMAAGMNYRNNVPGMNSQPGANFITANYDHLPVIINKRNKIQKYREMSTFPEISDALDIICDEALPEDKNGNYFVFKLLKEKDLPKKLKTVFEKEFEYIIEDVIKPGKRSRLWQLLRRFLIDGELYAEMVSSKDGKKLIGIQLLPTASMHPVYESSRINHFIQYNNYSDQINNFTQSDDENSKRFESNQVAYINYIDYGQDLTEIKGYLETARRVYNHLRALEDALVIYRLVRAPERRLWNVDTGELPPGRQEQVLQNMIQKYRRNINHNSETGEISSSYNAQSMVEDFWFAKGPEGKGTTVDVLQGGTNLGEMGDINYMQAKLYKVLKVPRTRWDQDKAGPYMPKKSGEIERDEIKFYKFNKRLQGMYREFITQIYFQHLRMKLEPVYHKYISAKFLSINFVLYNEFEENRRIERVNDRLGIFSQLSQDIVSESNLEGHFSEEYVLMDLVGMTEAEYQRHVRLRNRDKAKFAAAAAAVAANNAEEELEDYEAQPVEDLPSQESPMRELPPQEDNSE